MNNRIKNSDKVKKKKFMRNINDYKALPDNSVKMIKEQTERNSEITTYQNIKLFNLNIQ